MIVGMLPTVVLAASSGTCGDNLTWTLDNAGTLTISGVGAMEDYTTSGSVPWADHRDQIKSVIFGDGVTTIGNYAFYDCESLINVTIGTSVTSIGNYAFDNCGCLETVYYGGTEEEWNAVAIGRENNPLLNATICFAECEHSWQAATCTTPKICTTCGETEGTTSEHTYVNGVCVCGKNVPLVRFKFAKSGSSISLNVRLHYGQTKYLLTTGGYAVEEGASATNYNIKLDYTGDVFTIYLKDAQIANKAGVEVDGGYGPDGSGSVINFADPLNIVVESDSSISMNEQSGSPALNLKVTDGVTITSVENAKTGKKAKLTLASTQDNKTGGVISVRGNLILDDANVHLTDSNGVYGRCNLISISGGDLTVKGGKLFMDTLGTTYTIHSAILVRKNAANKGGNVVFTEGADVKIYANPSTDDVSRGFYDLIVADGNITFSESDVEIAVIGQHAAGLDDGGYNVFNKVPTLTYSKCYTAVGSVYVVNSGSYDHAWDGTTLTLNQETTNYNEIADADKVNLSYFKIAAVLRDHVYSSVVTDPTCTERGYTTYTCTICGKNYKADYTEGSALGNSCQDATCTVCKKQAYIKIPGLDANGKKNNIEVIINEGAPAKYLLTDENGKATYTGASETNYNIKFVYPYQGTPTLYLKNAKLSNDTGSTALSIGTTNASDVDFVINTETDSTLTTPEIKAICVSLGSFKSVTFTGAGKLSMIGGKNYALFIGKTPVTFKNSNVYIETNLELLKDGLRPCIFGQASVVVDGGKLTLKGSSGPAVALADGTLNYTVGDTTHTITFKNGANVLIDQSRDKAAVACMIVSEVIIDNASVEIIENSRIFSKAPTLKNVCAIAGMNAENAKEYNEKKATSYAYFKSVANGGNGHNYSQTVVVPTCTEQGYTTYTCTICGKNYKADYTDLAAHVYRAVVTDPTCTEQGYTTYTCTGCGISYKTDHTEENGHVYRLTVKDPTCTTDGVMTYKCVTCNYKYSILSDATGHSASEPVVENAVAVTCTTDGSYDTVTYCYKCNEELSRETTIIPATGHNYENDVCTRCDELIPVKYTVVNGEVTITGMDSTTGELVIPESIDGNPVTAISVAAFHNNKTLRSVVIPDSVTVIGTAAFYNCSALESVTIGNGVEIIGDRAFVGCKNLKSVTVGDSVTTVGGRAFYGCGNLTDVTLGKGVTTIGDFAFSGCESLKNMVLPTGVKTLGRESFFGCSAMETINIPNTVTAIGGAAFQNCTALTAIDLPESLQTIGDWAFYNCDKLTSVVIPGSVAIVGTYLFGDCDGLTDVTLSAGVTIIGNQAFFSCNRLTNVFISARIQSIGAESFYNCSALVSVTIPDSVTKIGNDAFAFCKNLAEVTYLGTQQQWNAIKIGKNNTVLTPVF